MSFMDDAFLGFAAEEENKVTLNDEMEEDAEELSFSEFVDKYSPYVGYYYAKEFYESFGQ